MKKIMRKQLKKDEFVSTINKIVNFAKKRTRELTAAVAVILFIILIFVGVRFIKAHNVKKESRLLTQILELDSELMDSSEKLAELEKLAGSGKFSRLAYTQLAVYFVEEGELDKAKAALEKMPKKKKDFFYYQAQDLLAQIHIKQKNYDRAIEIYKNIEEEKPKSYSLDVIFFHSAQAHEEKGELERALEIYKRIQDEFPNTYYGFDASQKVIKLEKKI